MNYISNIPDKKTKKRVVIVGGGFAGLTIAQKLDGNKYQVVLIDKHNNHQFQPLLYQVATSGIEPSGISFPFRKIFQKFQDFHFRMGEAISVDKAANLLETSIGVVEYDYLIIAMGCDTNYYGNNKLKDITLALKSTSDALYMRNYLLQNLENAMNTSDPELRKELLTFVIVGGGPTGVEMSGALAEMKKFVFPKDYPELSFDEMSISLINGADRLLATFSPELSVKTEKHLKDLNVQVVNNVFVTDYKDSCLFFSDGTSLKSKNVIWVAGITPNKIAGLDAASIHKSGRIITDRYSLVKGEENVFAIGDIAFIEETQGNPQVAQVAMQQAETLVENLNDGFAKKKAFAYHDKGSMATIGRNAAIAEIGKYKFSGFMAWFIWCFIHLRSIFGPKNKLIVFINWVWNYFTYDQSLRLIIKPLKRSECEKD